MYSPELERQTQLRKCIFQMSSSEFSPKFRYHSAEFLHQLSTDWCPCFSCSSVGSDLICASEVPVPDVADCAGGELGAVRSVLGLHRAVQRARMQERHCEYPC